MNDPSYRDWEYKQDVGERTRDVIGTAHGGTKWQLRLDLDACRR